MVSPITNTPNTTVFKPMQSVGSQYAIVSPITSEQKQEAEKHKEVKSHKVGMAIALGAVGTGFGVLALMRGPKGIVKAFKAFEKRVKDLKADNKPISWAQEFGLGVVQKAKENKDYLNSLLNSATLKDIWCKKLIFDKVGFVKKGCDKITGVFEKISLRSARKSYEKTSSRFAKLYHAIDEIDQKSITPETAKKLAAFKSNYDKRYGTGAVNSRLLNINSSLDGFDDKYWGSTFKGKSFFESLSSVAKEKRFHKVFVADDIASPMKKESGKIAHKFAEDTKKELDELMSLLEKNATPEQLAKIGKLKKNAVKSLDKSADVEADKLFDKLRDLKLGSGPTDFLGVIGSFAAAGLGLAHADSKDEKISVSLQYGIPAIGAVAISLFCTASLVAAGPSMAIGAVSGIAISKLGEFLDKRRKAMNIGVEKKEQNPAAANFPTLASKTASV